MPTYITFGSLGDAAKLATSPERIGRRPQSKVPSSASERQVALVVAGDHRQAIASAGWSNADVRDFLSCTTPGQPVRSPDDFLIVAAGGSAGPMSAFSLSWGIRSTYAAVTKAVETCVACD